MCCCGSRSVLHIKRFNMVIFICIKGLRCFVVNRGSTSGRIDLYTCDFAIFLDILFLLVTELFIFPDSVE